MNDKLNEIRQQLDEIDSQLHILLNQRANLALEVAKAKQSEKDNAIYYRPEREVEILQSLIKNNTGPLHDETIKSIFKNIISACLALQQPTKIAYLGPAGTFSQQAALKHFGNEILEVPCVSINNVFQQVSGHQARYGVVPIENSSQGIIVPTLEALMQSNLSIIGEVLLKIEQHLLRNPQDETPLRRIYAHQQSFAQCRHWLDNHMPNIEQITVRSNGDAAHRAKTELGSAAIAGDVAANQYGLIKNTENIHDHPDNATRFIILGEQHVPPTGKDKTSLLISGQDKPGALLSLLQPFADHDVNLTLIESRPYQHQQWDYLFLLDLVGHQQDDNVKKALDEIKQLPVMLTILGSYPLAN